MNGLTLDAGALIALERGHGDVRVLLLDTYERGGSVSIPAGVLAQVWRGRPKEALLHQFLRRYRPEIVPLDEAAAKAAGLLCARAGTHDVVDASVAVCARTRGHDVVTSDPEDIDRLLPGLPIHVV